MERAVKVTLAGAAGLILLVGLGLLALPTLISAERFRPALEAQVSRALGLPVQIGQLRLRAGLGVRLEAGEIRLAGVTTESGLEIERLELGLRLWPLLRGQVRLGRVRVEGVSLRLTRSSEDGSWALPWGATRTAAAGEAEPEVSSGAALEELPVERIEVRDARVVFVDRGGSGALREGWVLGPGRASLELPTASSPWRFELATALGEGQNEALQLSGSLPAAGLAGASLHLQIRDLQIEQVRPLFALSGQPLPAGLAAGAASGAIELRILEPDAQGQPPALLVPGVELHGRLELSGLQVPLGDQAEPQVLHADVDLFIEKDRARAEPLRLRLGGEQIEGKLEWRAGTPPELHGELQSRSLDLDVVLGALSKLGRVTPPAAGGSATGAPAALGGSLQVRIDSGRVLGLRFSSAAVGTTLEEGMLRLDSLSVALYGGTVEGRGSITMGREPLPFALDVSANGVDLEGALPALSPDLEGLLTGRFAGRFELRGRGLEPSELSENLRGTLQLDLRDGQLTSIGILGRIAELLVVVGGKGIGKETTPYQSITGDFDVRRGRAHTKNLALRSEDLDLDGEGSFGLDATLDFDVEGRFSSAVSAAMVVKTPSLRHLVEKDGRLRLRFRIYGALAEPRVEIDQAFLRQALRRAIQEKSRKKLEDKLKDLFR